MLEIARLVGGSDYFELGFVEREATLEAAMKFGIRLHLAKLSFLNIISIFDILAVNRYRATVHSRYRGQSYSPERALSRSRCG
jgi:hypothetical protein